MNPSALDEDFVRGNEMMTRHNYRAAAEHYRRAAVRAPHDPSLLVNYGIAAQRLGRLKQAEALYIKAGTLAPKSADADNNLGNLRMDQNRLNDAIECYVRAVATEPSYVGARINLGNALSQVGRFSEARLNYSTALSYQPSNPRLWVSLGRATASIGDAAAAGEQFNRALELTPGFAEAHLELGDLNRSLGDIDHALYHYRKAGRLAVGRVLECLLLNRGKAELLAYFSAMNDHDPDNLVIAAAAAYLCEQWDEENPYGFIESPLQFIKTYNICAEVDDFRNTSAAIILTAETLGLVEDPYNKSTRNGFQTRGNIFENSEMASSLLPILNDKITEYREHYSTTKSRYLAAWPRAGHLEGWCVRLLSKGWQAPHIHPGGWLSGVLYLKMPKRVNAEEGSIRFSLKAFDYPAIKGPPPEQTCRPIPGDLVLFPSCLFHSTIPFSSDEERVCLAFDLVPNNTAPPPAIA